MSLDVRSDDGCRMWVEQSGAGPLLVFCHGGPGLWDYLHPLARLLKADVRTIRWDQRGCGRSERRGPYTVARELRPARWARPRRPVRTHRAPPGRPYRLVYPLPTTWIGLHDR
ncbi:alpha/beta fold hydrolase [Solwaraspora sp. WMMB335]|uniref:alpha/beta fold hydrolase n=1 Tax=Solwaraspora sp. WMMB335 TaxID=3404118 RepID=UPI003B95E584